MFVDLLEEIKTFVKGNIFNQENNFPLILSQPNYWVDRYGPCRYRYRYMFPANIFADTDIFAPTYWPIFWPISMNFSRYLADTDIIDIQSSRYHYRYWCDQYRYPVCRYLYIGMGIGISQKYRLTDISVQP